MLRPYQRQQLQHLEGTNDNPVIVSPTGSGKGHLIKHQIENNPDLSSLVIVPNIALKRNITDRLSDPSSAYVETFQTLVRRKLKHVDQILIDEAHLSACSSIRSIIASTGHNRIIGYTATPRRLDGQPLSTFDRIIPSHGLRWFIDNNYLSNYRFLTLTDPSLRDEIGNDGQERLALQQKILQNRLKVLNLIDLWREYAYGLKSFVFCAGVDHARSLCNEFTISFPEFNFVCVDSDSDDDINDVLERFKMGKITAIFSVNRLILGVDVPDAECCLLATFTYSLVKYLQTIGRVLRYSPGKRAVILDPYGCAFEHGKPDLEHIWTLEGRKKKAKVDYCCCSVCGIPLVDKKYAELNADRFEYMTTCGHCNAFNVFQFLPPIKRRKKKEKQISVGLAELDSPVSVSGILKVINNPTLDIVAKKRIILKEKGLLNVEKANYLKLLGFSDSQIRNFLI